MRTRTASAISALMSAAAALPIVALPVCAGAQILDHEIIPAMLPAGAATGLRTLSYRESGERMKVSESVAWIKLPLGDNWEVAGSRLLDVISGASASRVSNQSGSPVQIITGASGEAINDRRNATEMSVKRKIGEGSVSLSRTISREEDYRSQAYGASATMDFNERNTTLALGYGRGDDEVRSVDDPDLNERRKSREILFGVTQLLDRHALLQSNLVRTRTTGFLNDPYRSTLSFYRDGLFPPLVLARDLRPDSREQWAWFNRYKLTLPAQKAVIAAEYRFYRDDWGIRAHTLYASWLQAMGDGWKWEAGLRYHSQNQADFYRAEITQRPVPRLTSSDQRLAAFGSLEPSAKVIVQLTAGTAFDLGISLYRQQGNWKIGGGTLTFEPLQALIVNAGIVHRF
ncbi:MAG: DUF3570 domain-containing protein [Betaproteobacteria bacterium]